MELAEDTELYMTSEGRRIYWEGLENFEAGGMVEIGLMMRGGGKKKTGNPWESLETL